MKRLLILAAIVAFGTALAAYQAPAQAPAPTPTAAQLEVVKLKDNLFVITSSAPGDPATFSGGNVSVLITDSGVTLVDTKLAAWGQALLDKVKSITPKPVTTIINTHTHGDHTGNNDKFGKVESDRAREHQGEHGEDAGVRRRQRAVPAVEDLHRQA